MTPRQLVAMVCATGTVMGLIGGLVALPVGLFLHRVLLTLFAAQAGTGLANGVLDVFSPWVLPRIVVIGVAVGVLGDCCRRGQQHGHRLR